jgi:flavin reductase (DIM6/NTAB) family NADH-FMN oxidoreductase RutF
MGMGFFQLIEECAATPASQGARPSAVRFAERQRLQGAASAGLDVSDAVLQLPTAADRLAESGGTACMGASAGHRQASMTAIHSYDPKDGHGLKHDPLNAIVAPRPIGWISTVSATGLRNLAPYSFFNAFNYRPPIIGFSSTSWKDSVRNIDETGQFVWNLATRPLAKAVNVTSAMVPGDVDEFALAGLTPAPSQRVTPPRVAESPVAFECQLTQLIRLTDAEGRPVDAWLTLGEVVMVHIDQALLTDGVYDTVAAEPILRGGGPADYFGISEDQKFEMLRPG